jgi:glycosyltransferase involved in cell wall biosynthesis
MSTTTPNVSIVIATYNMAEHVAGAIRSVLAQTITDFELLIIDDGSKDATREAVAPFLADARVRYVRQDNAGQARATNKGIELARGRFIAFCDADDLWTADKLALQLPAFEQGENVGVVYARKRNIGADGLELASPQDDPSMPRPSGTITRELFFTNFIPYGTAIVRKECFVKVGAFRTEFRMGLDWDLWLRISMHYQIRFVDAVTYLYRIWPGQMTRNWPAMYECAFRIMDRFAQEHPAALSAATLKRARADTYAGRGRLRSIVYGEYRNGFGDAFTALRHDALYLPAWKLLARLSLLTLGLSRPRKAA